MFVVHIFFVFKLYFSLFLRILIDPSAAHQLQLMSVFNPQSFELVSANSLVKFSLRRKLNLFRADGFDGRTHTLGSLASGRSSTTEWGLRGLFVA